MVSRERSLAGGARRDNPSISQSSVPTEVLLGEEAGSCLEWAVEHPAVRGCPCYDCPFAHDAATDAARATNISRPPAARYFRATPKADEARRQPPQTRGGDRRGGGQPRHHESC